MSQLVELVPISELSEQEVIELGGKQASRSTARGTACMALALVCLFVLTCIVLLSQDLIK